jgi:NitT/TauT family transport system permease protein
MTEAEAPRAVGQPTVAVPADRQAPLGLRVLRASRVWLVLLAGLGCWQLATRLFDIPRYLLPAPSVVVEELLEKPELYLEGLKVTAVESVSGFLIAALAGFLLGILIARSPLTEELLYPYLNIIRVTPIVAIAPLLTIWLGHGMAPNVVVAAMIAFFPIVVGTVLGLKSVDPDLISLMRILNAGELTELRKIRLPNALPYLFSAFRVSAPMAVIGALVGEFVGGSSGLGYLLVTAQGQLNTSAVFLLVVFSGLLGIVVFNAVVLVERRVLRWHPSVRAAGGRLADPGRRGR